jgi:predicted pyridoxine 5'-phosphate oxidase superfamily flavin-nucleotide-binding protein
MTDRTTATQASGYHDGELAVQQRAGVRAEARRLAGMLDAAELRGGAARFLAERTVVAIAGRDVQGRLWTSPLTGPAGFLEAVDAGTLHVHAVPAAGDPLHGLGIGQPVGLVAIELATSRRFRVNGRLSHADESQLTVEVDQAYGNCPQYIQRRVLRPDPPRVGPPGQRPVTVGSRLTDEARRQIRGADTFFLGTTHPTRGSDASHRGGPPGFVRVADDHVLWWPDYPGNNMFNSLGNLAVDASASLLFPDFTAGPSLHLSGRAVIEYVEVGAAGDDGFTGRRIRFTTEHVILGLPLAMRAGEVVPYPRNPPLRG